jgi:hypothetical protein
MLLRIVLSYVCATGVNVVHQHVLKDAVLAFCLKGGWIIDVLVPKDLFPCLQEWAFSGDSSMHVLHTVAAAPMYMDQAAHSISIGVTTLGLISIASVHVYTSTCKRVHELEPLASAWLAKMPYSLLTPTSYVLTPETE